MADDIPGNSPIVDQTTAASAASLPAKAKPATPIAQASVAAKAGKTIGKPSTTAKPGAPVAHAPSIATAAAAESHSGTSITERGWDGWPTKPTPGYLIPKMGELPVSSTVHFQTVVMDRMDDDRLATDLWKRVKVPLIDALRRKAALVAGSLRIQKAIYGDIAPNQTDFPASEPIEVTDKVRNASAGQRLSIPSDNGQFGDPAEGTVKSLRVYMLVGADRIVREAREGTLLDVTTDLTIERAVYGDLPDGQQIDVTDLVRGMVVNGALQFTAANDIFTDPAPNVKKAFDLDYSIAGEAFHVRMQEGETVRVGGDIAVEKAWYGDLPPPGTIDVTARLSSMLVDGKIAVGVENDTFGLDPLYGAHKHLYVQYFEEGGPVSHMVLAEHDRLALGSDPEEIEPTGVYVRFFDPEPETLRELAGRLHSAGLRATDFDDQARYATLEEQLETMLGVAVDELLDPAEFAAPDGIDSPAQGAILYHEQGWYTRGLALGNLLHSVALAPGEITQVAMTHWNHVTRATDEESTSQADSMATSDMQNRAVSEVQDSAVKQHEWGSSAADSTAVSNASATSSISAEAKLGWFGSIKGGMSGSSTSFGMMHNVSTAVTQTGGDKNVAMNANQQVNAATRRQAEASRTRRASVVREVSQNEDENITTRVVANYNHMHALTVMYFEVIEVFSLRTRVVDAERVIYLPYKVRDVIDLITKYGAVMIDAANAAGRPDLAQAIRHHRDDEDDTNTLSAALDRNKTAMDKASDRITQLRKCLDDLIISEIKDIQTGKNAATLKTEIEALYARRATFVASLSSFKALSDMFGGFAAKALEGQLAPIEAEIAMLQSRLQVLARTQENRRRQLDSDLAAAQAQFDQLDRDREVLIQSQLLADDLIKRRQRGPFHENRLFFNQAVWLSLSPAETLSLAMRRNRFNGEKISETIDPTPVALSGNYVAYRWRFADPSVARQFKRQYIEPFLGDPNGDLATVSADVALPTGGVFGEAVLGEAVSAEKIDLSRFWNWQDSMIPILPTSINPISAATPSIQALDATPGKLDESSAKLGALQDLPAPSGFGTLAQTMQAQMFRDMSGQEMLKTLAQATTAEAGKSERNAATIAAQNLQAGIDLVKDLTSKAAAMAAAPETGGASLLGGMVKSNKSAGASLLGGVLNAKDAGGNGDVFSKMTGAKGDLTEAAGEAIMDKEAGGSKAGADTKGAAGNEDAASGSGGSTGSGKKKPSGTTPAGGKPSGTIGNAKPIPPRMLEEK